MNAFKKILILGLIANAVVAHAGGSARVVCARQGPVLEVTYTTGADAGTPGLFWVGVLTSDRSGGAFSTPKGWLPYKGGLYPFHSRYDSGFPQTIKVLLPFPDQSYTTREYVDYTVYTGNGVYTQNMHEQVQERRAALNLVKPDMVAKGLWRPEFESDDFHMTALAQNDLTMNKKYGQVYTIPFVDCDPNSGGS